MPLPPPATESNGEPNAPAELDVAIETDTETAAASDAHDSAIIETAEEVEVPEVAAARVEGTALEAEAPPVSEPPVSEPPVSDSLLGRAELGEPRVAIAHSDLPPPSLPVLTVASPLSTALVSPPAPLAVPPASSRALSQRVVDKLPPRAVATARRYPVLWLVAAPVLVASLLVTTLIVTGPAPRPEAMHSAPVVGTVATPAARAPEPVVADAPKPAVDARALASLETLAGKDPTSLSVSDLLLLDENRATRERAEAQTLAQKLQAEPELAKAVATQASLLRYAADPATASDALAAMAQAPAPVGPDLLYEVWTNRATPAATAELARSLLYSRDVRPGASPALAAALELRSADSCEAVKAALPRVQASGDKRSIPTLIKLTYRRGCGKSKREDCYPCLRATPRELLVVTKAADSRRAPTYGAPAR